MSEKRIKRLQAAFNSLLDGVEELTPVRKKNPKNTLYAKTQAELARAAAKLDERVVAPY